MSTIIALFPSRWESMPESQNTFLRLGWRWTQLLKEYHQIEKAIFLNSVMDEEPGAYPGIWRRFIRVGTSLPEQMANLFELFFEKQYNRLIFAESICAVLDPLQIESFFAAAEKTELVLLPADDGSVLMVSMDLHLFPDWDFFRFHAEGSVVEMISECHAREITYRVFDPLVVSEAASWLPALLQKTSRPEIH